MTDSGKPQQSSSFGRRIFLGAGGAAALGMMFGGKNMYAEEFTPAPGENNEKVEPVSCAVIGLGEHGRALLTSLTNTPGADVKYVCDSYEPSHARSLEIFPKATATTEFKKILDDATLKAVWIATPTHLHKDLVLAALQAGKNVYCEMPLAHTIEDAKAIAKAAQDVAEKQVFHSGLQQRTNPQHKHVLQFVRTGALGNVALGRAFWHRRMSWRKAAANNERQKALNWRLDKKVSTGLMGEVGIHQIDVATWFLKQLPVSVTGFGGIMAWEDGREIHDTVQAVVEYPKNIRVSYDATLASSYDANGEILQGSDASVLIRDYRAWMFKEADAPALGWEVYAYKEKVGEDTGIALVADATKILAAGKQPGENREVDPRRTATVCACEAFLNAIRQKKKSACDGLAGLQATVVGIKSHEATATNSKIVFQKEWFEI